MIHACGRVLMIGYGGAGVAAALLWVSGVGGVASALAWWLGGAVATLAVAAISGPRVPRSSSERAAAAHALEAALAHWEEDRRLDAAPADRSDRHPHRRAALVAR
jgi:hypothetical protein